MISNITPSEKLKIIAYKDPKFQNPANKKYETFVNPEEFVENFNIDYSRSQGEGTTGTELNFKRIPPPKITLNIMLDATGALSYKAGINKLLSKPKPIAKQLKDLLDVIKAFDGDTHNTYYLKIIWGTLIFHGKLLDLEVKYSVFKPDGTPMRAIARTTFIAFKDDEKRVNEEGKNSPDLTHVRTVRAGDTLPLMTHRIYGDFSYYLEVARVNNLKDYRNLTPGTKLFFPPIDKQTA